MNCIEEGFRQINERKYGWPPVVNVLAYCHNSEIQMTSNDDIRGHWSQDFICSDNQEIVGAQMQNDCRFCNKYEISVRLNFIRKEKRPFEIHHTSYFFKKSHF